MEGQIVVVTGGAGRVGSAICRRFAAAGATVIVNGRTPEKLDAFVEELRAAGHRAEAAPGDITDETAVARLFGGVLDRHGRIDVLVNNAGGAVTARIVDMALEHWQRIVNLNLTGSFLCARAVLPGMMERRQGRIIGIGSGAYTGAIGLANYSASKAGMIGFTRTLALEAAPYGVTANVVVLGHIASPGWSRLGQAMIDSLLAQVPLGRFIPAEEVGEAVLFLASPGASNITGQAIHLTGGMDWVGPSVDISSLRPPSPPGS